MPLSPEEQKILQEIEKSFYEHDPQFSRKVSESTIYRVAGRNLKWLALGFLGGLILMIWSFTTSLVLGVAGFLIMLGCAPLLTSGRGFRSNRHSFGATRSAFSRDKLPSSIEASARYV